MANAEVIGHLEDPFAICWVSLDMYSIYILTYLNNELKYMHCWINKINWNVCVIESYTLGSSDHRICLQK